jgi:hypothetical protein
MKITNALQFKSARELKNQEEMPKWKDIKMSLRIEILANALSQQYDMAKLCKDFEIDDQYYQHSSVCLSLRIQELEKEETLIENGIDLRVEAMIGPEKSIDEQYKLRYGQVPNEDERNDYMQAQLRSHTLKTVDACVMAEDGSTMSHIIDQMFHCQPKDLRKAQEFLTYHDYDPSLAGLHWGGGDRAILESLTNMFEIKFSKDNVELIEDIAANVGIDIHDSVEMIGLTAEPYVNEEQLDGLDQVPFLHYVSSSDDEDGDKSKIVTLKLPNAKALLARLEEGIRVVRTPYQLPDRYAWEIGTWKDLIQLIWSDKF